MVDKKVVSDTKYIYQQDIQRLADYVAKDLKEQVKLLSGDTDWIWTLRSNMDYLSELCDLIVELQGDGKMIIKVLKLKKENIRATNYKVKKK